MLDTNVVCSTLIFRGPSMRRLREGWQDGRFIPLASTQTVDELMRVLSYPRFHLSGPEQTDLLADFLPWVEVVAVPVPPPPAPRCRDPSDMTFLHLAIAGKAPCLVTGDRDLLAVGTGDVDFEILAPEAFCSRFLMA